MFFVIDKSKIISYVLAVCTVVILFVAAAGLNNTEINNAIVTSTNAVNENNTINNTINNTKGQKNNSISNEIANVINGIDN